MENTVPSRVWLEISLAKLRRNLARIKAAVSPCGVIAVLKANAYGLGVDRIAEALAAEGVAGFAVAEPREALRLVPLGRPVQILGGLLPHELPATVAAGLIHPLTSPEIARAISAEAVRQGRTVACDIKLDTGMGRMGILWDGAVPVIAEITRLPNLACTGLYSHFPVAYRAGEEYTRQQIERFLMVLRELGHQGIRFERIHIANSDAINNFPVTTRLPFTHARTGINLHGSFDSEGLRALKLEPVLTLKARLVQSRVLPAGMSLGYGLTYTLSRDTRVGTVAAGYADGLPLALSNRGDVLIRGRLCPILGRVSMDYCTVSLEDCPDAREGDEVICLGGEGPRAITVDKWAQLKSTHPYEIICSFGSRVERRYLEG
ncbi:MAG: Alanine racemase [Lentisphaerae bacterium ADurb.BinA184]|nr:MAG: Alanine racemase [Lentisphaerae bacterium ADurb.BinA184]